MAGQSGTVRPVLLLFFSSLKKHRREALVKQKLRCTWLKREQVSFLSPLDEAA